MFDYDDKSCVTVVPSGNVTSLIKEWSQYRQVLQFNSGQPSLGPIKKELKSQAFCAVALLRSDSLENLRSLMSVTRPIDRHVIVYMSHTMPNHALIQNMNRPVIWALPLKVIAQT